MSTSAADVVRHYYCHRCSLELPLPPPPSPDDDVICPLCNSGFIEELPPRNPNTNPDPLHSFDLRDTNDLSEFIGATPAAAPPFAVAGSDGFDPFAFLHSHLNSLLSGGASIQIVVNRGGATGMGMGMGMGMGGGSMGDYFFGSGLEQLIQQLAENDPNRYGSPPTAKSAIAALPDVTITPDHLKTDSASLVQCSVCMENFEAGIGAKQLPCKHLFHKDCILPWLELHSSCPVCRYELPTDEESRQRTEPVAVGSGGGSGNASGTSGPASPGQRVVERRFRVSLPFWPFGRSGSGPGSQGEGSGDGNAGSGTGTQGGTGTGTPMEDLD
ncbi:E3 ubiquitin-protein ligase RING1-like [Carex rostrata]